MAITLFNTNQILNYNSPTGIWNSTGWIVSGDVTFTGNLTGNSGNFQNLTVNNIDVLGSIRNPQFSGLLGTVVTGSGIVQLVSTPNASGLLQHYRLIVHTGDRNSIIQSLSSQDSQAEWQYYSNSNWNAFPALGLATVDQGVATVKAVFKPTGLNTVTNYFAETQIIYQGNLTGSFIHSAQFQSPAAGFTIEYLPTLSGYFDTADNRYVRKIQIGTDFVITGVKASGIPIMLPTFAAIPASNHGTGTFISVSGRPYIFHTEANFTGYRLVAPITGITTATGGWINSSSVIFSGGSGFQVQFLSNNIISLFSSGVNNFASASSPTRQGSIIISGSGVSIVEQLTSSGAMYVICNTGGGGGAGTGVNIGNGIGIFSGVSGGNAMAFKSLNSGSANNLSISATANTITLIPTGLDRPKERDVYLVGTVEDQTRMGGISNRVYTNAQLAYEAASNLSNAMGSVNVALRVGVTTAAQVGNLELGFTGWNYLVGLYGLGKNVSAIGNIIATGWGGADGGAVWLNCGGITIGDINTSSMGDDSGGGNSVTINADYPVNVGHIISSGTGSSLQDITIGKNVECANILSSGNTGATIYMNGICGDITGNSSIVLNDGASCGNITGGHSALYGVNARITGVIENFKNGTNLRNCVIQSPFHASGANPCVADVTSNSFRITDCYFIPYGSGLSIQTSTAKSGIAYNCLFKNATGTLLTVSGINNHIDSRLLSPYFF